MGGYRNIYYEISSSTIHLWTWDENGERICKTDHFEPYLYIESEKGTDGTSIFNTPLKKIKFRNQFDRVKFLKETPLKRIFYNLNTEQQYLLDTFKDEIEKPEFGNHPLRIFYLDIETYATDHFASPQEATDPVNLITVYDSLTNEYHTWGVKDYHCMDDSIHYHKCLSEQDLLKSFVSYWRKNTPDIVTGWNIHGYDIPYIMNRLTNLFGDEYNKNMSPIKKIRFIENASVNKLGRVISRWSIGGVSIIDYMDLYESLCGGKRESMSLNYISEYELGDSKTTIETTSLSKLADTDWYTFVEYNIQDVRLVLGLETKLKYLGLIRNLSYRGFIPFEKSMGKVSMITGAVTHQALKQGLIIPTFNIKNEKTSFAGGYVHEPIPGLYESLVTYDANSLYPNTIITLNISPETKIGKIIEVEEDLITIKLSNEKTVKLTRENFKTLVQNEKLSITKANVLYTQKFKGVVPTLIDRLYKERVEARNKMLAARKAVKKTEDPLEKARLTEVANDNDILSNVYKTFLNSIYGIFSQIYSPLFDIDHAKSITLTGQAVVKNGARIIHEYAVQQGFKGEVNDITIYSDTDSNFLCLKDLFKVKGINLLDSRGKVSPEAKQLIDDLGNHLNLGINEWAKSELKSTDPRYFFKREKICDVALLEKKKYYILHILDKEGVSTKEFEYKGVEVAKAMHSKEVKDLIKEIIESAILSKDRTIAANLFQDSFEKFKKMRPEEISSRKKVNNYGKYADLVSDEGDFANRTPYHVKSSYNFNDALKKLGLEDKYPPIDSGAKVKLFYCTKNSFGYQTMGFISTYPPELLERVKPDYKIMFEKNVVPLVSRIFQVIGWPVPVVGCQEATDLVELFSRPT